MKIDEGHMAIPIAKYDALMDIQLRVRFLIGLVEREQVKDEYDALRYLGYPEKADELEQAHRDKMDALYERYRSRENKNNDDVD